jgi:zinc transporter 1/2/3
MIDSLSLFKFIAAASIFAITVGGAWPIMKTRFVSKLHKKFTIGEAFASGVFLGAAFFHMLPQAHSAFNSLYPQMSFPAANLLCALGFILLLYIEKITVRSVKQKEEGLDYIPYIFTVVLCIHALIDGATVGINTDISTALIIFTAIIVHKGSESFSLAITLNHSELTNKQVVTVFMLFAFVTPIGIALGSIVTQSLQSDSGVFTQGLFNAIAAGTFLYMATMHNSQVCAMHKSEKKYTKMQEFFGLGCGLAVMGAIAFWV